MRRRTTIAILTTIIIAAPFVLGYAGWRHHFPHGWSHCCELILYNALEQYARTHGGALPAGEATPEALLSLLYREHTGDERLAYANLLRSKTVPESVVREILERGGLLTPETCGWHYVEGLRADDDPRIAVFWDKAGLDHNGGRMTEGGHIVMFVAFMQREHIPEAKWDNFLEEQRKLLAERKAAIHHDATIQIDDREVRVKIRLEDDHIYGSTWGGGNRGQTIATVRSRSRASRDCPSFQ